MRYITRDVREMNEELEVINNSPELKLFFKNLWTEKRYSKTFFAHKHEIFPRIPEYSLKDVQTEFLFWSKPFPLEEKEIEDIITSIELRSEKAEKESSKLISRLSSSAGFDEISWNGIDLRDLIVYYLIKFARNYEQVRNLINEEDFSLKKLKENLKNYDGMELDFIMDDINFLFENKLDMIEDDLLRGYFKKIRKAFSLTKLVQMMFRHLFAVQKFTRSISSTILHFIGFVPVLENLCKVRGLDFKEYESTLIDLYRFGLINNQITAFWCENCIEDLQIILSESKIAPSKLEMRCLKCGSEMIAVAMIELNEFLVQSILSKDGLLGVAVAWLLEKKEFQWEYSVYNDREKDFICDVSQGKVLIEVKMHRFPESIRSFEETLAKDVNQLVKHIEDFKKRNERLISAFLVYNCDLTQFSENVRSVINSKFPAGAKDIIFEVIDYNNLPSLLDELKKL